MSSSASSSYCFTLGEIKEATNNFDEKKVIGHGGEGKVYLANIHLHRQNEKTPVALKHLKPNSSDQFEKEIQTISKIHHLNLVSLLGHCQESGQKILVYEYMQKGSLSKYVKKKNLGTPNYMPWNLRLNICIGAARGLQHLHTPTEELPKGIIHRDIKPANILLGKHWVAKVSDFGLFKLSHAGQTDSTVSTYLKGTRGYCAPEYYWHNQISRKIDVYAFGVVMFEVLCRKSPWDRGEESYIMEEDDDLGLWARENVDPEIKEEISEDSLVAFTEIIWRCLQRDPTKRPTMDDIVLDLERCRICTGCKEIGHGRLWLRGDGAWHAACFRCRHCDLPIPLTESKIFFSKNRPIHISCYKELYHRCDICKNFIPTTAAGLIDSWKFPFWKQKFCRSHMEESRCLGCGRIEAWDTKYQLLEDGRKLCPECMDSAIMDTNKCQPLYLEIQEFYERLNMKIEPHVPLLLVERQALDEAMKRERSCQTVQFQSTEIQGLILFNSETFSIGGVLREMFKYPHSLKVKAILILYGLPRLLTGRILVHVLMHAWLRLEEYPSLSPNVEGSMCEVLVHKWLTSKIMECSGSSAASTSSKRVTTSSFEKQLAEYYKYVQESNTLSFGDAFREGQKAVLKYGLQRTLEHIKVNRTFPRC